MGGQEVAVVAIVFSVIGMIGYPLAKALARRIDGGRASAPAEAPELTTRLDRIERAVESIAVEVERISEGQRFVTKLMADRTDASRQPEAARLGSPPR